MLYLLLLGLGVDFFTVFEFLQESLVKENAALSNTVKKLNRDVAKVLLTLTPSQRDSVGLTQNLRRKERLLVHVA